MKALRMKNTLVTLLALLLTLGSFFFAGFAGAAIVTFQLDYEFSGATPPSGLTPWLTATFDDQDSSGSVELTMAATNLTDAEHVKGWYFNFAGDLTTLSFSYDSAADVEAASINTGTDAFKADGDGFFDILFVFANGDFREGEESVYSITGTGITADSFDFFSAPGDGNGSWTTAAHIGGIGPCDQYSGWVGGNSVPIPGALWLLGSGLIGLVGMRKKLKK